MKKEQTISIIAIDYQEKLLSLVENKNILINNTKKLLEASKILGFKSHYTEQNPTKLGSTVVDIAKRVNGKCIKKLSFSCLGNKNFIEDIISKDTDSFIICGVETHICVQQTVIDLLESGFMVYVVVDAMSSRHEIDHKVAIKRMSQSGAILTTTEAVIFELCRTSERKEFKEISILIKGK